MKRAYYFLLVLSFTQCLCYSYGMTYAARKSSAYIKNDISESLQNLTTLSDAEDFEPDFNSFYPIDNLIVYFPYVDIISNYQFKGIIYLRHLILAFISDIPPPCFFML
jgi:hypothetical protein